MVAVASPVDILLIDGVGRRVGAVYENGVFKEEANEIEGAIYSGRDKEPELIITPHSNEEFVWRLYGTDNGNYTLTTLLLQENNVKSIIRKGEIKKDEIQAYTISVLDGEIKLSASVTSSTPKPGIFFLTEAVYTVAFAAIVAIIETAVILSIRKRSKERVL